MQLIADSGSTKTTWVLLDAGNVKATIHTSGMNPYFHTSASIEALLQTDLVPFLTCDHVQDIHFYGSGCSTENNDRMISDALQQYFRKASVYIFHDILGAARALFGHERGIAGILGTGCNSCYYDGKNCHQEVDSLGYMFGDEGAGSNLGKSWLSLYLKKQVPEDLRTEFDHHYRFTLEDILNAIYNRPYPNRFLASFSEFLAPRQKHPFIGNLVKASFEAFVGAQLNHYVRYQPAPVAFVGSIGYFYREILEEVMHWHGLQMGKILRNPMEGLILFHTSE